MALPMPRPFAHSTGTYYLNTRVPSDLAAKARGSRVSLPVAGRPVSVTVTDKVFVSLRTKDAGEAKLRFGEAAAALSQHWAALRDGPRSLSHAQVVALAGETYRREARRYEADDAMVPDGVFAARHEFGSAIDEWRLGSGEDDGYGEMPLDDAVFMATAQLPRGPHILAWQMRSDVDRHGVVMTYDQAVEDLFGAEADRTCAERHLILDARTRLRLLKEIGNSVNLLVDKLGRNAEGDYSPDQNRDRFPTFDPPTVPSPAVRPARRAGFGVADLYERWKAFHADKRAASTIRRYGPSLASLNAFTKGEDVGRIDQDRIDDWAKHRRDVDGIAATTVNRNDLVAASAVLDWATTRDGGRLLRSNPAIGVRLEPQKREVVRDRTFLAAEIKAILLLARRAVPDGRFPRAAASRRWAPWLCAYSGARIQEVCWLSKEDVWQEGGEGGIWVMRLPRSKTGRARTVPLHDALVREGFLAFWQDAPAGFLFVGDRPQKAGVTRSAPELRASELAAWIQKHVKLEPGVSPNHGWRHSFISAALAAGVKKPISNIITGHNQGDVADRYVAATIKQLKASIDLLPAYIVE